MIDLTAHVEYIVRRLLGEPNHKLSTADEWRFGRNGSLAIIIEGPKAGQWFDHEHGRGGGIRDFLWVYGDLRDEAAHEWLARELGIGSPTPGTGIKQQKIATYTYVDERGQTLFWVYRYGPKKTFSQAQPGSDQGGIKRGRDGKPTMQGARYVPYHLDEIAAAAGNSAAVPWRVLLVEGEKDCDKVRSLWGVLSSTGAGGAGKWRNSYNRYFAGADAIVIGDCDDVGREHARKVGAALASVAASVRVVELPGLPEHGDLSDFIDAGGSQSDFEDIVDGVEPLPRPPGPGASLVDEMIFRQLSDITMRPIDWLWPNRIARGKLTLIAGHPGLGKSQVAVWIAAIASTGGAWPDGGWVKPGRVLILSAEDDPEDTLKPRLIAAGCDESKIVVVYAVRTINDDGQLIERGFSIVEDVARLAALVEHYGDVSTIIIDPITAYMGEDIDSHQTVAVRAVLRPLQEMAAKHHVAEIGITHLRKNSDGDAVLLVTGSLAFVAASRATYFVMRDDANPARRLFLTAKNNLGADMTGYAYAIEPVTLPNGIRTSRVVWEYSTLNTTADEEIARRRKKTSTTAREMEIRFLKDLLGEGPVATQTIKDTAKAAGMSWRSIERAARDLGIVACKSPIPNGPWEWRLPD